MISMEKRQSFASAAWSRKGKVTLRGRFPAEMDAAIPWSRLLAVIDPHDDPAKTGRQPHDLERILRMDILQQWFNLSDPQAEDAIYDSQSMRRFTRVELGEDEVPEESRILRFRQLLENHKLTESIFEAVEDLLTEHRLLFRAGTIVDVTIIATPSPTKNAEGKRDPEVKQTRKGNYWHFGMKLHIGQLPDLLHGEESTGYGDQAYWKEADRQAFEVQGVRSRVNRRAAGGNKNLSEYWRKINRARSRTWACCEDPFRIILQLWEFEETRYRTIAKHLARVQTMFALANLYAVREKLMPPGVRCVLWVTDPWFRAGEA